MTRRKALELAIKKIGGVTATARAFGISPAAVSRWKKRGYPPSKRVVKLERWSGVSRHDLDPRVFGSRGPR